MTMIKNLHQRWRLSPLAFRDYDNGKDTSDNRKTMAPSCGQCTSGTMCIRPGWKLTLSQNIAKVNDSSVERLHSLNVGGMFEAWFQVCRYLREQACAGLFAGSVDLIHRQAQGQILRIGIKVVLRLQVTIRVFRQIVLKQR